VIWAAARALSPARTASALTATQSSAAGSAAGCRDHAAFHRVGRAARSQVRFAQVWAFSARPPAEPRGHLSVHVALQ